MQFIRCAEHSRFSACRQQAKRGVLRACVAACALHVSASQDVLATWTYHQIVEDIPVVPPNASETSLRILRTSVSPLELWVWPQRFHVAALDTMYNPNYNSCTYSFAPLGRSWLVYTLDETGMPATAAWRPSINAPSAYFTPRSAVYDPLHDVVMALGPAEYVMYDACVARGDPNVNCTQCHILYMTADGGCVLWTNDTYLFDMRTATWTKYSVAMTGEDTPQSVPPWRWQQDSVYTSGLVHAFDPFTGRIVSTGGYQNADPRTEFSPVWEFDVANVKWERRNVTWIASSGGQFPNAQIVSTISRGVAVVSPVRHELIIFGGADVTQQYIGGFCYRLDLDEWVWNQQHTCDFTAYVAPFLSTGAAFALGATPATRDALYLVGGVLGDPGWHWVCSAMMPCPWCCVEALSALVQIEVAKTAWLLNLTTYEWTPMAVTNRSFDTDVEPSFKDSISPNTALRAQAYTIPDATNPSRDRILLYGGVMLDANISTMYFDPWLIEACSQFEGGLYALESRYVTYTSLVQSVTPLLPSGSACTSHESAALLAASSVFAVMCALAALSHVFTMNAKPPAPVLQRIACGVDALCTCASAGSVAAWATLSRSGCMESALASTATAALILRYFGVFFISFSGTNDCSPTSRSMADTWTAGHTWRTESSVVTARVRPTRRCASMKSWCKQFLFIGLYALLPVLWVASSLVTSANDWPRDGISAPARPNVLRSCYCTRPRRTWLVLGASSFFGLITLVLAAAGIRHSSATFCGFLLLSSLSMIAFAALVAADITCTAARTMSERNARLRYETYLDALTDRANDSVTASLTQQLHVEVSSSRSDSSTAATLAM